MGRRTRKQKKDPIELVVNTVAGTEGISGAEVARRLKLSQDKVRAVLREAEALGCVYKTGAKRSTKWWLG